MKNLIGLFLLAFVAVTNFSSCEKEEPSDRERIVGDWDAVQFIIGDEYLLMTDAYLSIQFEFESDGDFKWTGIYSTGRTDFGMGDWTIDGSYLELEFTSEAQIFCNTNGHRFNIDFDGDEELNLEDICNGGLLINIQLDKN